MTTIVTVASGKQGVGKSVLVSNLGILLAREGRRVVLVDLDIGRANLHTHFGIFEPILTLTDFLSHRVSALKDIAQTIGWGTGLRLIPGMGATPPSINFSYAQQQRLLRHLRYIDADIIILDCAPGITFQALDVFLLGDHQLVVANPDPASVIELYRFLKLAAIRKMIKCIAGGESEDESPSLMEQEFETLQQIVEASKGLGPLNQSGAEEALREFQPLFVLNRTTAETKMSITYLQRVIAKFIGSELVALGEIPQNEAVGQSVRVFQPVVDLAPKSSAAKAFIHIMYALLQRMQTREQVPVP